MCLVCGGCNSCRKEEEGGMCTGNELMKRVTATLFERQTDLVHMHMCV